MVVWKKKNLKRKLMNYIYILNSRLLVNVLGYIIQTIGDIYVTSWNKST